jgi:tRNA(fMet)-specific endonuclease VapC
VTHLLDTDHVSILQHGTGPDHAVLLLRLSELPAEAVGCCVVSFHEQALGVHTKIVQARTPAEIVAGYNLLYKVIDKLRKFPLVPFDAAAQDVFTQLKTHKVWVGTPDLRIAAPALGRGLTLVTRNRADFDKVPGLRLADWTR